MSDEKTMNLLNKLRRLPENRICGTCRQEDRLGFSAVCVKFQIFVCGDCKSAHQAYSHRCKSVTMSNWTMDEVNALREESGGGNAINRARFFAKLPRSASTWPRPKCPPDQRKEFILTAYSDRAWEADEPIPPPAAVEPPVQKMATAPSSLATSPAPSGPDSFDLFMSFDAAMPAVKDRAVSTPAPDVLDWGAFDSAPAAAKPTTPPADLLDSFAAFDGFTSAPAASPLAASPLAASPLAASPLAATSPLPAASSPAQKVDLDFFATPPPATPPPATTPISGLSVESQKTFSATVPAGAAPMPPMMMPSRPMNGAARMPGGGMPQPGPPPMAGLAAQMPVGAMAGMPMPRMPRAPGNMGGMSGGMGRIPGGSMPSMAGLAAQMPQGAMAGMPMPGMVKACSPMHCGA